MPKAGDDGAANMSSGRGLAGSVAAAGVGFLLGVADRVDTPNGSVAPLLAAALPVVEVPKELPPKSEAPIANGSELAEKAATGLTEGRLAVVGAAPNRSMPAADGAGAALNGSAPKASGAAGAASRDVENVDQTSAPGEPANMAETPDYMCRWCQTLPQQI